MKLNLLPTTVSKGKQGRVAVFFSVLIGLAGILGAGYFAVTSNKALDDAKTAYTDSVDPAQKAYEKSVEADTIMNADSSVALIRDATLATDMIKRNDEYPDLYESLKPYIPSWFRVNSLSAAPTAADSATVTIVGTIDTYQQYANLMLAFSRYPGAVSVSRTGFQDRSDVVPSLNPVDQVGKPRPQDAAPIPDDKFARLSYFQSTAQPPEGYTGVGNFGSGTPSTRGAMPTSSLVIVSLVIAGRNLQVPDPRTTLSSSGAGAAAPSGPGGAGGPSLGGPGGPGGIGGPGGPRGPGGPPKTGGGPATKGGGKKGADDNGD